MAKRTITLKTWCIKYQNQNHICVGMLLKKQVYPLKNKLRFVRFSNFSGYKNDFCFYQRE